MNIVPSRLKAAYPGSQQVCAAPEQGGAGQENRPCLTSQTLMLPDGRRLGYAEYGDPEGQPLFFFHGTPGSRLSFFPDESVARSLAVRVVAPERPGFGLSDFQPGRTLLDWPDDVAALATALGIQRFAVLGYSGGGPYAAACAYRLPERLTAVAIVSGMGPLDLPGAFVGMSRLQQGGIRLVQRAPWLLHPLLWLIAHPRRPCHFLTYMSAGLPKADRFLLRRPAVQSRRLIGHQEAVRAGLHGFAWEVNLLTRPWGFRLQDIAVKVHLWHGEQDVNTPLVMGRSMADALPQCWARFVPEEGHFLLVSRWQEILAGMQADMCCG